MAKRLIATLLTDFGTGGPYVAAMKGVLLSHCPNARLVDISHEIPPQDVLAGAFVLAGAARYYPPETLHVVVVDPGVGTERRILAGRFGGQRFLFPDNGVITMVAESMPLEAIAVVRNVKYLPAQASMTFHGRDIFAPLAAQILNGLDIRQLGPQPDTYKLLDIPAPRFQEGCIIGQVVYVDRFGNLISNIAREFIRRHVQDLEKLTVTCAGRSVGPPRMTYALVKAGEPLSLINSLELLEVAVNRGNAAQVLGAGVGADVRIEEGR